MNHPVKTCVLLAIGILSIVPSAAAQQRRFVAYFPEWGIYSSGRYYVPADVPADRLTHLNYAFIKPIDTNADGYYECAFNDTWAAKQHDFSQSRVVPGTAAGENIGLLNQLRRLRTYRQQNGQTLPLIFSIGASSVRDRFSAIASNPTHRQRFVDSCIQLLQQESFDGFDIDWETPSSTETANYTGLLQAFRDALTVLGTNPRTNAPYLLTAAVPGAKSKIDVFDVVAIEPILDWVNVMIYDFHGCWGNNHTGHNSPLRGSAEDPHTGYSGDAAIREWLRRGMPAGKINLGLAYYGRAAKELLNAGPNPSYPGRYAGLDPARNNSPNCVVGSFNSSGGTFDYWDIVQRFVNVNGYIRYWDGEQEVPYLYNPNDPASYWISYDDPNSISTKVHYARNMNLGGIFAWELSLESKPQPPKTYPLTDAAAKCLN
ncbi:MAG TPA: glycoside hydrolase family 18 protein [Thermoanaerobaculia bacterium]|jgi:chitinase